jgi:2-polyprenyl-6-methoxyphenol hydroxylase-like FAD-dependent oxidoreductase
MRKVLYLREDEIGGVIHVSEWSMRGIIDERYGEGQIFLAGDACKMHLATGGLGMNIGVQDVYNLCWKLKLGLGGQAASPLLDRYEV